MSKPWLEPSARLGLVFPGQGSQFVGMGHDLYELYPEAQGVFDEADAVLGFSLAQHCFEGPETELAETINAQPAIVTVSAALLAVLRSRAGEELVASYVAGHSLGEYTAYLAAGVLSFAEDLRLVRKRGQLMKQAGEQHPGAMAAVLGLSREALRSVCIEVGDVWLTNDNCPGQAVLSGTKPAMDRALKLASERGARKTVPLAVTIPGHCPLMNDAAQSFAEYVAQIKLNPAAMPVIANSTAQPISEPEEIRSEMASQLTSGVQWISSVNYMISRGVNTFIEIGPKSILCGLIRQIDRTVKTLNVSTAADIAALVD